MTTDCLIQEAQRLQIDTYQVDIQTYLGQYAPGIDYFEVEFCPEHETTPQQGLLRVGSVNGGLQRELDLRQALGDYKMVSDLLAHTTLPAVQVQPNTQPSPVSPSPVSPPPDVTSPHNSSPDIIHPQDSSPTPDDELEVDKSTDSINHPLDSDLITRKQDSLAPLAPELQALDQEIAPTSSEPTTDHGDKTAQDSSYLEEEYYPETIPNQGNIDAKLLCLSPLPASAHTLETWLSGEPSIEESLWVTSQICQFFWFVAQRNYCFAHLQPKFVHLGKPIQFFDLTDAYPTQSTLPSGLVGPYCAPELAYEPLLVQESITSYIVSAVLYHAIHHHHLSLDSKINLDIRPQPQIYQLLTIGLSLNPDERFALDQLRDLLVAARQTFSTPTIQWQIASHSTVGLATNRLQNEDSYGIRQHQLNNGQTLMLAAVADGMGGMAQGEVASQLAIQTVLEDELPADLKSVEARSQWLNALVAKANAAVTQKVKNGGTTLSIVLTIAQELMIAHVGDSRIYLIRNGHICQLSHDHSMVAMLLASGQISYEESLDHPDGNILTRSLGAKQHLNAGYAQDLNQFENGQTLTLIAGDILLLCSDGVWGEIETHEIAENFTTHSILQTAVNATIQDVLNRGASDNATLIAAQINFEHQA